MKTAKLNHERLKDYILFTVTAHQGLICILSHQINSNQVHVLNINVDAMYLPEVQELHTPEQLKYDLPREAKSEYCPLRRNKSTATCCPEQSKANFL